MKANDVFEGRAPWSCEAGDNLPWLQSLPANSCRLTITSPPYEDARSYEDTFNLEGQAWVDFMAPRVVECCRITDGLVCVNMAGRLDDGRYQPVVEWLVADLTRKHGLVCGPAPYVYFRFSVPGSGGKRYHRRDWEPVYCFAKPESLPLKVFDNTAMGMDPKWNPGGPMSNRNQDGSRVNEKPKRGRKRKAADADGLGIFAGAKSLKARGTATSGQKDGDNETVKGHYAVPDIANPGNVIREMYDAEAIRQILAGGEPEGRIVPGGAGGDVLRFVVGGGNIGNPLAHEGEAPFPERFAEFFIRSFSAENDIILEPFCGSGTVPAVAQMFKRRCVACDLRQSQVDLTARRMESEFGMFAKSPHDGI